MYLLEKRLYSFGSIVRIDSVQWSQNKTVCTQFVNKLVVHVVQRTVVIEDRKIAVSLRSVYTLQDRNIKMIALFFCFQVVNLFGLVG